MSEAGEMIDVVTIGRASVDLYGIQAGGRLEDMRSFAKYVGGCPANIAIGCARLGLNAAFITRVGEDHMGRFISEQMQREGVATTGIIRDTDRLTALVVLGIRNEHTFPLIFYRENCADMALSESDIDADLVQSARAVVITGTHLSNAQVKAASMKAAGIAKKAGNRVVLDIDYRPVLWGLTSPELGEERFVPDESVTAELQAVVPVCDLIVGTEEEFHILGGTTDTLAALRRVRELTDAVLVCKRGADGCAIFDGAIPEALEHNIQGDGFPVEIYNVLGAGDAFMSGFLRGWLRNESLETCCRFANASGAIVVSRHGCAPAIPTWDELDHFLTVGSPHRALRQDKSLEQLHWSTTRTPDYDDLMVLAIDHRSQFDDLVAQAGGNLEDVPRFKALALDAIRSIGEDDTAIGLLVDGRYGAQTLEAAADRSFWVGRPIEKPGSCPLEFDTALDVASELAQWPTKQVVKCLCFYHPGDSEELRSRQDRQLSRLFSACRNTGHELLLEVICSKSGPVDADTVATIIRHFYGLGIYPDWWKLEPSTDQEAWRNIAAAVLTHDPHCRGILILGLAAEEEALAKSFQVAAQFPSIRGFAVGRTIFSDAAQQWFANHLDDDGAVDMLRNRFCALIEAWRSAHRR